MPYHQLFLVEMVFYIISDYKVIMTKANGISGKATSKLQFYFICNGTSEFVFIAPVFQLQLNLLLRRAQNSSNLNQ